MAMPTTATTLQTIRTINGTNFNGSANITTANWGTARNIGIVRPMVLVWDLWLVLMAVVM
mgnify:CR=1 FL=1